MAGLYISFHKFTSYKQCPAMVGYQLERREGVRDLRNALVGFSIHHAAEAYLREQAPLFQIPRLVTEAFRHAAQTEYIGWRGASDRGQLLQDARAQSLNLRDLLIKNDIRPANTKSELTVKVTHKAGLTIGGRIDILKTEEDGTHTIFDLKATHRPGMQDTDQFGVYFILASLSGSRPMRGAYLYTATGLTTDMTPPRDSLGPLLEALYAVARKIDREDLPHTPGHACTYCDFRRICPRVGKAPPSKIEQDDVLLEEVTWT